MYLVIIYLQFFVVADIHLFVTNCEIKSIKVVKKVSTRRKKCNEYKRTIFEKSYLCSKFWTKKKKLYIHMYFFNNN